MAKPCKRVRNKRGHRSAEVANERELRWLRKQLRQVLTERQLWDALLEARARIQAADDQRSPLSFFCVAPSACEASSLNLAAQSS